MRIQKKKKDRKYSVDKLVMSPIPAVEQTFQISCQGH